MTTLTEPQAQQFLAKKLKERIEWRRGAIRWLHDDQPRVRDTEWQHIAMLVEEKMAFEDWNKYLDKMKDLWTYHHANEQPEICFMVSAPYTLRASAMKEAGL